MKRLLIVLLFALAFVGGVVFAHTNSYVGKAYTFHRDGHAIDVILQPNNVLAVKLDNIDTGTRTNFCTPVP